jgi:hypothetical protein
MIWVIGNELEWLRRYKELWGAEIPWAYKEGADGDREEENIDYRALDDGGNEVDMVLEVVQCQEHGEGYARGWALWLCDKPFKVEWVDLASGEKRIYLAQKVAIGHIIWVGGNGYGGHEGNWSGDWEEH